MSLHAQAERTYSAGLRAALESTLRALQKAINGNQMDGSWIMAELEARAALNHKSAQSPAEDNDE